MNQPVATMLRADDADGDRRELIGRAVEGDVAAAVRLLSHISPASGNGDLLAAFGAFLRAARSRDLVQLAARMRSQGSWGAPGWSRLQIGGLDQLIQQSPDPAATLVLCSMHRNGYLRQVAVERMGDEDSSLVIGALLLRCEDWVPEVRSAALTITTKRLSGRPADIVPWLPLIERLGSGGPRGDDVREIAEAAASDPEIVPRLVEALHHTDVQVRQAAARRLVRSPHFHSDAGSIFRRALRQDDPFTTRVIAQSILEGPSNSPRIIETAAAARLPQIRAMAIWSADKHLAADARSALIAQGLTDRSSTVRRIAQLLWSQAGQSPSDHYRQLLNSEQLSAPAILGLGETGNRDDCPEIATYLDSPLPRMRTASISSLGHLASTEWTESFLHALPDPSPRVAKTAQSMLRRQLRSIDPDRLWSMVRLHRADRPGVLAFELLASADPWAALDTSFAILTNGPHELDPLAIARIEHTVAHWAARSPHHPPAAVLGRLRDRLPAVSQQLDAAVSDKLDFSLAPWFR